MSIPIRIVGRSHHTQRIYLQREGGFFIFDYGEMLWSKMLIPISNEEVVIDMMMGEWEEIDEEFTSAAMVRKAIPDLKPSSWIGNDSDILEHRLEISLMAAAHRTPSWIGRFVILCRLRLRGVKAPWKMFTKEKSDTGSEGP